MAKERTAFYDNYKFILIALVVVGHFSGILTDNSNELKVFWRWIYMFHMPAFLFVGGMFAKKLYTQEAGLRINVIAFYLVMGTLFYCALWLWKHLYLTDPTFDLLNMGSIPWYFFVMAALGASTAIIAKIRGGAKVVIPVSILFAVLAGFADEFDDFLVLGRTFTYAPFYFAGYFLSIQGFLDWVTKAKKMVFPVILAICCMVGLCLALLYLPKEITGTMSGLATGHNPYHAMGYYPSRIDACIRLLDIAIAFIMIVAIALVTPIRNCIISGLGARTLQVYIVHPFIYYAVSGFDLFEPLVPYMPLAGWCVVVCAVLLAALLAAPKWPEEALQKFRKLIQIDNALVPKKGNHQKS